jgi:Fur family ferric uptake transcriptional regulator
MTSERAENRSGALLPLSEVEAGVRVRVEQFQCGRGMASRLTDLGLHPGTTLEVLGNSGFGPLLIAVKGARLGVGREMAQRILVQPLANGDEQGVRGVPSPGREAVAPDALRKAKPLQIPLNRLFQGERGVIRRITGRGYFRHRLMEMGFTPGTEVYVQKYAPLKDPIEYVVKGYHVSLRREEAGNVIVEPVD